MKSIYLNKNLKTFPGYTSAHIFCLIFLLLGSLVRLIYGSYLFTFHCQLHLHSSIINSFRRQHY